MIYFSTRTIFNIADTPNPIINTKMIRIDLTSTTEAKYKMEMRRQIHVDIQ